MRKFIYGTLSDYQALSEIDKDVVYIISDNGNTFIFSDGKSIQIKEGNNTISSGLYSHAEGDGTNATGEYSHAEGYATHAEGHNSHAEGHTSTAVGQASHAEGQGTLAKGTHSHAGGTSTVANTLAETVIGQYNVIEEESQNTRGEYMFVGGNGTDPDHRSNAFAIGWDGSLILFKEDGTPVKTTPEMLETMLNSNDPDSKIGDTIADSGIKIQRLFSNFLEMCVISNDTMIHVYDADGVELLLDKCVNILTTLNIRENDTINGYKIIGCSRDINKLKDTDNLPFEKEIIVTEVETNIYVVLSDELFDEYEETTLFKIPVNVYGPNNILLYTTYYERGEWFSTNYLNIPDTYEIQDGDETKKYYFKGFKEDIYIYLEKELDIETEWITEDDKLVIYFAGPDYTKIAKKEIPLVIKEENEEPRLIEIRDIVNEIGDEETYTHVISRRNPEEFDMIGEYDTNSYKFDCWHMRIFVDSYSYSIEELIDMSNTDEGIVISGEWKRKHTVEFIRHDDTVLYSEHVVDGEAIADPTLPILQPDWVDGEYRLIEWYTNIEDTRFFNDTRIYGNWELIDRPQYVDVIFCGPNGEPLESSVQTREGDYPQSPYEIGFIFTTTDGDRYALQEWDYNVMSEPVPVGSGTIYVTGNWELLRENCPDCGLPMMDGICENPGCIRNMIEEYCPECGAVMIDGICPNEPHMHYEECPDCGLPMMDGMCENPDCPSNMTFDEP